MASKRRKRACPGSKDGGVSRSVNLWRISGTISAMLSIPDRSHNYGASWLQVPQGYLSGSGWLAGDKKGPLFT